MQVDIRLLEYLLSPSVATPKSLTITFNKPSENFQDSETYFGELVTYSPPRPDPDDSRDRTAR